ncbi:hypothetical protein Bbelb_093330 [Branchiostoma belcheri]|nr:hypothetical protein Bbelb_093330 [Branchiostoma belcheri]
MSDTCKDASVCLKQGDTFLNLGSARSGVFMTDEDGDVILEYHNLQDETKTTKVTLTCDPSARVEPVFESPTLTDGHLMSDGSGTVSLHALDNPAAAFKDVATSSGVEYTFYYNPCSGLTVGTTVADRYNLGTSRKVQRQGWSTRSTTTPAAVSLSESPAYTFYYNPGYPCSGLTVASEFQCQGRSTRSSTIDAAVSQSAPSDWSSASRRYVADDVGLEGCSDVSGCAYNHVARRYSALGAVMPDDFTPDQERLIIAYSDQQSGMSFNLTLVCDVTAAEPKFAFTGTRLQNSFDFMLTTRCACADECAVHGLK